MIAGRGYHIGVVIHDSESWCLAVRRRQIKAVNAQMAEAWGVLEGCCMARQRGFSLIVIESNSKGIIDWLN